MKSLIYLMVVLSFILAGCAQPAGECSNPLEGFWESRYSEWNRGGEITVRKSPDDFMQTKAYGKEHFVYIVRIPDSIGKEYHGGRGKYKLSGDTLFEMAEPWDDNTEINEVALMFRVEIRGDSLFQEGPINEEVLPGWEDFHFSEIFVRKE